MVNPAILEFINQQRALGVPEVKIREALFTNGWKAEAVDEAFNPQMVVHPVTGKIIPETAAQTAAEAPPQLVTVSQLFGGAPTPLTTERAANATSLTNPVVTQEITRPPTDGATGTAPAAPAVLSPITTATSPVTAAPPEPLPALVPPPESLSTISTPVSASATPVAPQPASATAATVPGQPTPTPSPTSNSLLGKVLLVIAAVLVVLLGGGFAAYAYYQSMPEVIVQKMFTAAPGVKTVTYTGTATVHLNLETLNQAATTRDTNPSAELGSELLSTKTESITTINFTTTGDFTNLDHFKGMSSILVSTDAIENQISLFEAEFRADDPVYFFNIKQLPAELAAFVGSDFLNQWIRIDATELAAERAADSEQKPNQTLTPEQTEQIAQVWKEAKILSITKKLPAEVVTGSKSYHLAFALNETAFKQALLDTYPILAPTEVSAEDRADFADSLDEFLDSVEFKNGEIWIDQNEFFVRKIQFQVAGTDPITKKPVGYVDITTELSNFNEPVVVPEPSPYKTIEELMSSMYGSEMMASSAGGQNGSQSEAVLRGQDTGRQSDSEQLLSAIERYQAFNGHAPWVTADAQSNALSLTKINTHSIWVDTSPAACPVLEKLSQTSKPGCQSSDELKVSFAKRISNPSATSLYVYNPTGRDTFICFQPKSAAFIAQAEQRCVDSAGSGLPPEMDSSAKSTICGGYGIPGAPLLSCLP